jgi:D-sedoheptulose 7-phosphate isomerase
VEKRIETMAVEQSSPVRKIAADYVLAFSKLLQQIDLPAVERVIQRLRLARDSQAMIYVAGNGGSSATASHWVNDLGKATKCSGCTPMRVMSLSDNVPWLTALANDIGVEAIFSGQLENFAQPGDVLVVISASGNSPNLVHAVELGKSRGVTTIGFLGFDGGILKDKVDDFLWLPTQKGAYALVEDSHAVLCHILTTCLAQDRPAALEARSGTAKHRDSAPSGHGHGLGWPVLRRPAPAD